MRSPEASRAVFDQTLLMLVVGLILFGLVMLSSASSPVGYENFGDGYYFVKHQIFFGLVPGIIGLIFFLRFPYNRMKRHAFTLFVISVVLLLLVFIPGIGSEFGSSNSWISIGGLFSVQPAEIVKLTFLFYLAAWLEKKSELVPFLIALGSVLFLIMLQPDLGTTTIITAMAFAVYFVAGAPVMHLLWLGLAGLGGLGFLIAIAPYRAARFTTFLHPELDPQGIGYHINQALLAIGSGGILGLGYGQSRQKFEYLPEVAGDSIFAVIAEEMGFVISVLLVLAFAYLFWRGVKIAKGAPDAFGRYVATGIVVWITLQAFINIGSMTSIMPMTGTTLPFVSYGGTSLAVTMSAIGVLLNISKSVKTDA
ncbi:MAG: putative lipid II flippase FtsW [Patescibacteria group bacterium]